MKEALNYAVFAARDQAMKRLERSEDYQDAKDRIRSIQIAIKEAISEEKHYLIMDLDDAENERDSIHDREMYMIGVRQGYELVKFLQTPSINLNETAAYPPDPRSIGKRIAFLRSQRKISMDVLAKAIGTKSSAVSDWENNKNLPSAKFLIGLSNYFNVSIDWVLKGEEFSVPNEATIAEG